MTDKAIGDEDGSSSSPAPVKVEGVSKRFPGVQALQDVSLTVDVGEVHGWVGENGAGKSTLIKILGGMQAPDTGVVRVDGRAVSLAVPNDALRNGLAFILQELAVVGQLTVAENIVLGREPRMGPFFRQSPAAVRSAELLASIGFEHVHPLAPVASLSKAEQQGVMIARALNLNAKVVFMDETTAALDDHEVERLFEVIRHLKSTGRSTVFVSHRLEEVLEIADRVTVFKDGQIVASQSTDGLTTGTLIRQMVGREFESVFSEKVREYGDKVLDVREISTDAVADISFTVRRGEILGLGGLVGSGRSEVLRALFGIDALHSGQISIQGTQAAFGSVRRAIRSGIGLVPEDRHGEGLVPLRSVEENITLTWGTQKPGLRWISRGRDLALDFIEKMRIRTRGLNEPVGLLSGGNQQKVVLARCLAARPDVLLLDEPTRGVDVGAKAEIYKLIDDLARDGMAVVLVTSELLELLGLSDRILVLREGKMAGMLSGDAEEEEVLSLAMGHTGEEAVA